MNKESFMTIIGAFIVVIIGVSVYYIGAGVNNIEVSNEENGNNAIVDNSGNSTTTNDTVDTSENGLSEYDFTNEYGDGEKSVTIKAKKCDRLTGFSGASSNVYYIDWEDKLHHLVLTDLEDKVVATNIDDYEITDNGIIAYYIDNYSEVVKDNYVTYKQK